MTAGPFVPLAVPRGSAGTENCRGQAGAILFGADIDSCACDDNNGTDLTDTAGFDVLNGLSLLCHYTNRSAEKDRQSTEYLLALSKQRAILALPEEDTICINGAEISAVNGKSVTCRRYTSAHVGVIPMLAEQSIDKYGVPALKVL